MTYRLILFLTLNFLSLGLARLLGGKGPRSEWYAGLDTAPWTPSGVVIGLCWTVVMVGFSIYLAYLWPAVADKKLLIGVLIIHYILSLVWNPAFFYYHQVLTGLVIIIGLTVVIGFLLFYYWPELKFKSLLIAPYLIWMVIATSLNVYVFMKN